MRKNPNLDKLDIAILKELQKDCRLPLQDIAKKVDAPTSTVHYRVKRLERDGVIERYIAQINPEKVKLEYITIIDIRAKYRSKYYEKVGRALAKVPGVWAVYYVLGDVDFIVLTRAKDKAEYLKILDQVMEMEGVDRSSTKVVARVIKEDSRLELD
jgi:Lrp/AsnC family leucine-responsive transcriptional regulator